MTDPPRFRSALATSSLIPLSHCSITMSAPSSPSAQPPPTLTTLPPEIQLLIVDQLGKYSAHAWARQSLRQMSRHFRTFLRLNNQEWFIIERAEIADSEQLLFCVPCQRPRRHFRFSPRMRSGPKSRGNLWLTPYGNRFCIECGIRPLTGTRDDVHKYGKGNEWEQDGITFVRCLKCGQCARRRWRWVGECIVCDA